MPAYSEHDAWATVLDLAEATRAAMRNYDSVAAHRQVQRVEQIASAMIEQLARGVHKNPGRNPPLLVLGNPGRELPRVAIDYIGPLGFADALKYRHDTRGQRVHRFELKDTRIWCVTLNGRRCFTIENEHNAPVWDDIPNT